MTLPPIPTGAERLLLVEGPDDIMFFDKLIEHVTSKTNETLDFSKFAALPFGGAQQLVSSLELLARDSLYDQISHIGIVRDSDFDTDAFASVCSAIITSTDSRQLQTCLCQSRSSLLLKSNHTFLF